MISVIVCSIRPEYLEQLKINIAQTIGVPFEVIALDNRGTGKGICQVYNELAKSSIYPYLVFVHEDVIFRSDAWGANLVNLFNENPQTGAIGIAGGNYKSAIYSGWLTNFKENDAYSIIHNTDGNLLPMVHHRPEKKSLYDAVCLDGVFIASTKANWEAVKFNESQLTGFHFYDLDYSIRTYLSGKKVWVWMDLHLEHITEGGDFGDKWVTEAIHFHNYMRPFLPLPNTQNDAKELAIAKWWLDFLKGFHISWKLKWKWISHQRLLYHPVTYYNMAKFLFYTPLKLNHIHSLFKKIR